MPVVNSRPRTAITLILFILAITFSGLAATQEAPQPVDNIRTATVKEMQIAGSYVYLLVMEKGEEVWLATAPEFIKNIKYGDVVEFQTEVEMQDFHSSGLGKTFASLWFVSRIRVKQDDGMQGGAAQKDL